MKCPRCDVEMVIGKTISPYEEANVFYSSTPIANAENLKLVDCLKCSSCGLSEALDSPVKSKVCDRERGIHLRNESDA